MPIEDDGCVIEIDLDAVGADFGFDITSQASDSTIINVDNQILTKLSMIQKREGFFTWDSVCKTKLNIIDDPSAKAII